MAYARRWAYDRNPQFYDFSDIGGDCTNFISQCLYAGSGVMNFTPVYGWYFISLNERTASWSGVQYLHDFLTSNEGAGPYGHDAELEEMQPGDVIQLSFDGEVFRHSLLVVSAGEKGEGPKPGNILISTHTFNAFGRALDTYTYALRRQIHIDGART